MPRQYQNHFPQIVEMFEEALSSLNWDARWRRKARSWSLRPRSEWGIRCAHAGSVAFSWAATQLLAEAGITPDVVFGHSLGLHSALVASGGASITDALEVVDRTARFIAESHAEGNGAMLAVTGFTPNEITEHCARKHPGRSVYLSIVNSRRQVVLSGTRPAIDRCVRCLKEKQAWGLRRLPGRRPLHCPLMAGLTERCADLVEDTRCHVPHVPLIHPTTGEEIRTVSGVEQLWRTHLIGNIDYVAGLEAMKRMGVATYIEVGVGDTLTQLGRWYRRDLPCLSIGKPEMLKRILDAGME